MEGTCIEVTDSLTGYGNDPHSKSSSLPTRTPPSWLLKPSSGSRNSDSETPTQRNSYSKKQRRSCEDRGQETRSCSMTGRNSQGVPNPESDILWVAFQRPTHLKDASVVSATAPPSHREFQEWETCANDGLMVLFSLPPQEEKWTMLKGSLFKYLENRQINVLMPSFTHTVQPHAC
jgi:hypothetical protein